MARRLAGWLEQPQRPSFVSLASLWEISIKAGLGKLRVSPADRPDLPELRDPSALRLLPIEWPAIRRAGSWPMHHRDLFDLLLVAEAQLRGLPILSLDNKFDAYGIERIGWSPSTVAPTRGWSAQSGSWCRDPSSVSCLATAWPATRASFIFGWRNASILADVHGSDHSPVTPGLAWERGFCNPRHLHPGHSRPQRFICHRETLVSLLLHLPPDAGGQG